MTEGQISLLPFYKGWDTYQELLIKAIEPLSLEQLSLRPAPHLRSIGENAAHIVGTRVGWFHFVLNDGGDDLVARNWAHPNQPPSTPELISGLELTWQVIQDGLRRWTPADLDEIFQDTDDDGKVWDLTRQWVIWHLIEHDLHHGGEISLMLGMYGLGGIDI